MKLFFFGLGLHLLVLACSAEQNERVRKPLVPLEEDAFEQDDRIKRASSEDQLKLARQSPELPPEYVNFLQQLSVQRDQGAAAQQQSIVQQPQQPISTRYVLSQDGRLIEDGASYLSQTPQQFASVPSAQFSAYQQPVQSHAQSQAQAQVQAQVRAQIQAQLQAQQPQLVSGRTIVSPELAAFSRQQQQLQQQYADAPLRAQITGGTRARTPGPVQPTPVGPNSQSPQVFLPTPQPTLAPNDPRLRASLQSGNSNFVYAPVPIDAQTILQQQLLQQQAQLSLANDANARQLYTPTPQTVLPQQVIYQSQPTQQDFSQERALYQQQQTYATRRPPTVTPSQQPQILPQNLPQQYLIETTRPQAPQPQTPQYIPQEVPQQVQYQQSQLLAQQAATVPVQQKTQQSYSSTLLQPVAGRGIFVPVKPSRSSIFVSRSSSSTPRPVALGVETDSSNQKIPVVRLPSPSEQRPLTRQELEAYVNAGYAVSPVPGAPEALSSNYLKAKRQQPPLLQPSRNHVIYENHSDGVQYQYSPGSKTKKSILPKNL